VPLRKERGDQVSAARTGTAGNQDFTVWRHGKVTRGKERLPGPWKDMADPDRFASMVFPRWVVTVVFSLNINSFSIHLQACRVPINSWSIISR
jgi:hypothetical protein